MGPRKRSVLERGEGPPRHRKTRSGAGQWGPASGASWSGARGPRDKERYSMANKILIPTPLRPFTGKQDAVEVDGKTIGELLVNLTTTYAGLKPHLYNEQGKLRSFVNVYLNDEDIRYLEKEKTAVKPGDTISIIPSVAGGRDTWH